MRIQKSVKEEMIILIPRALICVISLLNYTHVNITRTVHINADSSENYDQNGKSSFSSNGVVAEDVAGSGLCVSRPADVFDPCALSRLSKSWIT